MNLPNKLTVGRILATPVFMLLMLWEFPGHYLAALVVFAAAALTDLLDGRIARSRHLVTDFGKFLDPLADKMLTTAAFLGFLKNGIGWQITWIVFIVLFREFLIASLRLVAVSGAAHKVVAANYWGKAKTVSQMVGILFAMAVQQVREWNWFGTAVMGVLDGAVSVLFWVSAVLCIISGVIYLKDNREFVNPAK